MIIEINDMSEKIINHFCKILYDEHENTIAAANECHEIIASRCFKTKEDVDIFIRNEKENLIYADIIKDIINQIKTAKRSKTKEEKGNENYISCG